MRLVVGPRRCGLQLHAGDIETDVGAAGRPELHRKGRVATGADVEDAHLQAELRLQSLVKRAEEGLVAAFGQVAAQCPAYDSRTGGKPVAAIASRSLGSSNGASISSSVASKHEPFSRVH